VRQGAAPWPSFSLAVVPSSDSGDGAGAHGAGTQFNLAVAFETVAGAVPERECLVWGERRVTYGAMAERSRRLASYLAERGLGARRARGSLAGHQSGQDHLALALYNGNEYLEGMLGAYRARVAPFNVNYRYVGEELRYLLRDAGPRAIVYHAALAPTLAEVLPDLPPVPVLLHVDDESGHGPLPGAVPYEDALAEGSPDGPDVVPSPDDLYVLYTGGTTGMPKGVLWRQHDIFVAAMGGRRVGTWERVGSYPALAAQAAAGAGFTLGLLPPLMHGAAQWAAFMMFAEGATVVLPDNPRRLDPADVWRTVAREGVQSLTVVGDAMLRPLLEELDRAPYDASSLIVVGNGGAPLTPAVRAMARERLPSLLVSDSAGSSETGAQMHAVSTDAASASSSRATRASAGSPRPGRCRSATSTTPRRRRARSRSSTGGGTRSPGTVPATWPTAASSSWAGSR
jgi:acyl-CoA synthetase (AMP-forming)/AMP-acid ligase II